jgi:hypothetical protein
LSVAIKRIANENIIGTSTSIVAIRGAITVTDFTKFNNAVAARVQAIIVQSVATPIGAATII